MHGPLEEQVAGWGGWSMRSERWAETEADPLNQAGRGAWVFFTGKALEKFK